MRRPRSVRQDRRRRGWPSWLIASGIVSVARTRLGPLAAGERLTVSNAQPAGPGSSTRSSRRSTRRTGSSSTAATPRASPSPSRPTSPPRTAARRWSGRFGSGCRSATGSSNRWRAPSRACGRARCRGAPASPGVHLHRLTSVHVLAPDGRHPPDVDRSRLSAYVIRPNRRQDVRPVSRGRGRAHDPVMDSSRPSSSRSAPSRSCRLRPSTSAATSAAAEAADPRLDPPAVAPGQARRNQVRTARTRRWSSGAG